MKKVSVVILNWNGVGMLRKFLPGVVEHSQGEGVEVCVADNASTDASCTWVREAYPDVRLIELDENYGFAEGYNRALQQVETEYVVLLNSDVEVTPHWLEPLCDYMDRHPEMAACQPKIRSERNKEYFEYAGAAGGFIDCYGYPFCRGRIFDVVEKDKGQYDSVAPVFWATGAALFIRLKDYREAGGLDARFFAHMEEIDLCWRLGSRGRGIVCVPRSVVYHVGAATLKKESPRKTFLNFRNNLLMLYKNLPEKELDKVLWIRGLLDYVAAAVFYLKGEKENAKAVIRARKEFEQLRPSFEASREDNLKHTVTDDVQGKCSFSILWKYHVCRAKHFSQLLKTKSKENAMKHILSILLLLMVFTACGDKKAVTDVLNRAEVLINERPDSSLFLLRSVTIDDFRKESNRARYALLHSQALDKNYIDVTNDSLISVAVEYYKDKEDVRAKFLSYYYMGRVHANGERYLQATSCLMEAEQLANEVGDDYLSGLLYSEMGRIYRLYYDYPKSLEAHQKAAEYYERAGKIRHRNYMWLNQSSVYRNMNKDDEGERLLNEVLESARTEGDITLIGSCQGNLVMLYIQQGRMEEARSLYEQWRSIEDVPTASSSFMAELATMYASEGDFIQANKCIEQGWKIVVNAEDSVSLFLSSAKINYLQGKGNVAYEKLVKGMSWQYRGIRQALQQPILTIQRDYFSEKLKHEAYQLQTEQRLRILYILFSLLLLVMIIYFSYRQLKTIKENSKKTIEDLNDELLKKDSESRHKIGLLLKELKNKDLATSSTIDELREALKTQQDDYALYIKETEQIKCELQKMLQRKSILIAELFKRWFVSMSKLVFVQIQKGGKEENKNKRIRNEIALWQEKYYEGNKAFRELERLVNMYNDDAMLHFRNEIQWGNEKDYRRVCCFFAGISIHLIAIMMGEKEDAVYQNRFRLRKFLEKSDCLYKELYLVLLGK